MLITGATGKLGRVIVLSLAKAGANCICVYNKNNAGAKSLQTDLCKMKVKSLFIPADLIGQQGIENVFAAIEKFHTPQILINCAAVFERKQLENISFEYIRQTFDINFAAAIIMIQKFVKLYPKTNNKNLIGKIINVTDIMAAKPPAGFSIYNSSKAALAAATKTLAKELAPNFTVNDIAPGVIHWEKATTAEQKKKIISNIPANRAGSPEEVADAVKFVIQNDYITGQTINVDGGKSV